MSEMPINILKRWLDEARDQVKGNWNAMCVSTIGENETSDSRMVLMKQFNGDNIVFFTNYDSKKGHDLLINQNVSVVFFWDALGRQIRIQGKASKTSREISEAYYNSRPIGSRVSAILSHQSQEIKSYDDLREKFELLKKKYAEVAPVCPSHWGGIEIEIVRIEFWQEHESRLHERRVFSKNKSGWDLKFLSP